MILLIKRNEISKDSPLGGNIDASKLLPAYKAAQVTSIAKILGKDLYEKMQQDFKTESLRDDYLIVYNNYVKPMLIHLGASYYLTTGSYHIDNKGIYKASNQNAEAITQKEVDYIVKQQEKLYDFYKKAFFEDIHQYDIPEYKKDNNAFKNRTRIGGWSLSKGRNSFKNYSYSNSKDTNDYDCWIEPEW